MADVKGITRDGLLVSSWCCGDEWIGTADELVCAGLVDRALLPGAPGTNKVSATYYQGKLVGKGKNRPHDEHYLSVMRYGKHKFIVRKGVSTEEERRRKTRDALIEKHPYIDFNSLAQPAFCLGEKAILDGACVEIIDIRYEKGCERDPSIYSYRVDPNFDDTYNWFSETVVHKRTEKTGSIIAFPHAAKLPVQQPRRSGRLPKEIASFWDAQCKRWSRERELKKLREKVRSSSRKVRSFEEILLIAQAELYEMKRQMQDLLN